MVIDSVAHRLHSVCDATALIVAVDKGSPRRRPRHRSGREVSWANIRDKLNIGLFDAAHLIATGGVASSLGLGQVKVPIVAPFALGVNGNRSRCRPRFMLDRGRSRRQCHDPLVTAQALARVVAIPAARS